MQFKHCIFGGHRERREGHGWNYSMEGGNLEWGVSVLVPAALQASPADFFKELLINLVS